MTARLADKLKVFYSFTWQLAELSWCKRAQTAAIIFPENFQEVLAIGYNGPPAGENNDSCTGEQGDCGCVHAEANAITKLHTSMSNLVMLTRTAPCIHCAGLIVNSQRIKKVIWKDPYRNNRGLSRLIAASIELAYYDDYIQELRAFSRIDF